MGVGCHVLDHDEPDSQVVVQSVSFLEDNVQQMNHIGSGNAFFEEMAVQEGIFFNDFGLDD